MNRTEKRSTNNLYVAEYRRRMKARAVEYKGGKCSVCGYGKSLSALDFHHRDPKEKDFSFGKGRTRKWESLKKELDKCDILCKNCHCEVHDLWREELVRLHQASLKGRARSLPIDLPCSHCGKPVRRVPSQMRYSSQFCDKACQDKFRSHPPADGVVRASQFKISWPTNEVFKDMVARTPMTCIARELGVSDKAVRKRCLKLGIQTRAPGKWTK